MLRIWTPIIVVLAWMAVVQGPSLAFCAEAGPPDESAPEKIASEATPPDESAQEKSASEEQTPKEGVPEKGASEEKTPKEAAPEKTPPEGTSPKEGAAARPPKSETLFPETTVGFVSVADFPQLRERFNSTQLGKLLQDPVMEPFAEDLKRQFQDRWSGVRDKLGVKIEDLRGLSSGEVAMAMIQPAPQEASIAALVDVTGNIVQATELIEKIAKNLETTPKILTEGEVPIFHFQLPKIEGDDRQREVFYFIAKERNLLGASDNGEVVKGIVQRLQGEPGKTLADVEAFQKTMARCREHAGDAAPQLHWFVQPLGYMEAIRAATPERYRRRGKTVIQIVQNVGFEAIQGVGGFVDFALDDYEILHRTAIYAPKPYEKSMKMLKLETSTDFAPQDWVPRDVANYTTLYWDLLTAFDNFGPLFDELAGQTPQAKAQGKSLWKDVLKGLKQQPNGPRIDLRKDVMEKLGNRVTIISDYELPITPTSERLLAAVPTNDEKGLAEVVKRALGPSAVEREVEGYRIWEVVEEQAPAEPIFDPLAPELDELEDFGPPAAPVPPPPGQGGQRQRLFPKAAVTVAHGQLFVASNIDFLLKILKEANGKPKLGRTVDYERIEEALKVLGADEDCARVFARTDEEYRPTYELIKQGEMPESKTLFGQLLNAILSGGKKGEPRKQRIDGSKLPDYEVVRRYLGPAGFYARPSPEGDGWLLIGFSLKKGE